MDRALLTAECGSYNLWRKTQLYKFYECTGDIENHLGRLRCNPDGVPPAIVSGTVLSTTLGTPLSNVWIQILGILGDEATATTDENGQYEVGPALVPGELYEFRFIKNGYIELIITRAMNPGFNVLDTQMLYETCRDVIQNSDEEGVDCGGLCEPCAVDAGPTIDLDSGVDDVHVGTTIDSSVSIEPPYGVYQLSCRNYKTFGTSLLAECINGSNLWISTRLDNVDACPGEIENRGGALACNPDITPPDLDTIPTEPPTGSYQQSCRNFQVDRALLVAECIAYNLWRRTQLYKFYECNGDIENYLGNLRCKQIESL